MNDLLKTDTIQSTQEYEKLKSRLVSLLGYSET